jgi:hypothetical protein
VAVLRAFAATAKGIDSILSSCKAGGLDGFDEGGSLRLSNLIKGKLRILLGYLLFAPVGSYRGSPISDQHDTGFEVVFQVFRVAFDSGVTAFIAQSAVGFQWI